MTEVEINLVTLVNELKLISFLVLMFLKVSQGQLKPQGGKASPFLYLGLTQ
jgi:hypothetical protein